MTIKYEPNLNRGIGEEKFAKIHSRCFYSRNIKFNACSMGIQRNIIESKKTIGWGGDEVKAFVDGT
jgi:hypothetical protein